MKFRIPYYISNNGDGSASLVKCASMEDAQKFEEKMQENEGWGESCTGWITVEIKDGKLCYQGDKFVDGEDVFECSESVYVELEPEN